MITCRSGRTWLSWKETLPWMLFLHCPLVMASLQDLTGRYVGAWTNLTFGSTGKAVIEIRIAGTNASLIFNMDGYVFGQVDPPVIEMPGTVQGDTIAIDNKGVGIFGDISGVVDGTLGTMNTTLTNVPGGYIQRVINSGTITNGVMDINYTVDFNQPPSATNPAHGVMVAYLTPDIVITQANRQGGNLVLNWSGGLGPFVVQTSTNLAAGTWVNAGPSTTNSTYSVPVGPAGNVFLRIAGE